MRLKTGGTKVTPPIKVSGKQSTASVDTVDVIKNSPLSDFDVQMMIMMVVVMLMTAMVRMHMICM